MSSDTPVPSGWVRVSVENTGGVRLGLQRSPARQTGRSSVKYVRAANITTDGIDASNLLEMDFSDAEREVYRLRNGDVLLTEASGSSSQVGRAAIWRDEVPGACFQNTVIRFRAHAVTPEFALIVFRHYAAHGLFAKTARGVGIQHLGASRFARLPMPVPPLEEQGRIASAAGERTMALRATEASLRNALRRVNEQDREILAAATSGALVEQEVDIAQREKRHFESAAELLERLHPATGLKQGSLLSTNRSKRQATVSPPLPPGWLWVRNEQLADVRLGKQLSGRDERGEKVSYLRVANVLEDLIDISDVKTMSFTVNEHVVFRLKPGDILLNEGQSIELVGRPAMFRGELPDVCFQNSLILFRASIAVRPAFALLVFRHYLHSGQFQAIARRSTNIAHLGLERFAGMPFPLPPLAEQDRVIAEATAASRRLETNA